jgi:hypothetical protein
MQEHVGHADEGRLLVRGKLDRRAPRGRDAGGKNESPEQ